MAEKTVQLGTDVAAFALFHPDDLGHRAKDPLEWYSYDFAYRRESAAGRLIVFFTGGDGGYRLRLTTGELTAGEAANACASWTFPLRVRHGRVLLDNTDALPSADQVSSAASLVNGWFELPNGAYAVTVQPVAWPDRESAATRASYVILFKAVDDIAAIATAPAPPELRPDRDWQAAPIQTFSVETTYLWPAEGFAAARYPALAIPDRLAVLPGQQARLTVDEKVAEAAFPQRRDNRQTEGFVLAPRFARGGLAILARPTQLSRFGKDKPRLVLVGSHLVRLGADAQAGRLTPVDVAPVDKPDLAGDLDRVRPLLTKLRERAEAGVGLSAPLDYPAFQLEQLATFKSAEGITSWALMHLDMPFENRMAGYAQPLAGRLEGLGRLLDAGPPAPGPSGLLERLRHLIWKP